MCGLYGLKQAVCQWYLELNNKLASVGLNQIESDWSMHVRRADSQSQSISTTSVDNMLIASSSITESNAVVADIAKFFEITDNHDVRFHLGCAVTRWRSRRTLKLDQHAYTVSILHDTNMDLCNVVHTPMQPNTCYSSNMCPQTDTEKAEIQKTFPYTFIVGKCMYLSTCMCPDISYTVRELARFMSNYSEAHIQAAKHLLRYLQGTRSHGLLLGQVDSLYPMFHAMCDSDWGMGDARKSISGFVVMMGDSPLSWSSKQQVVVALSLCEAEYLAAMHCAQEVLWFRNLFSELSFPQHSATTVFCDNQGTVLCTHDPHGHTRMKHIDIRAHFICNCVNKKLIDIIHIPGTSNIIDLFTKPLHCVIHKCWTQLLRLDSDQGGVSEVDRVVYE